MADQKKDKKPCNCMVCQHGKEFERILKQIKDPIDQKIMWHFWNTLEDVETSAEVWKAKAYGTWPGWAHNRPKCSATRKDAVRVAWDAISSVLEGKDEEVKKTVLSDGARERLRMAVDTLQTAFPEEA